jgi:polysaccharide export outer membrane protein
MFTSRIFRSPTAIETSPPLDKYPAKLFFSLSLSTILFCFADSIGFAGVSLAQTSIDIPKPEPAKLSPSAPEQVQEQTSQPIPSPTNGNRVLPYNQNLAPNLEQSLNSLEQFNLYRLDVGDNIAINVPNFSEFSGTVTIDTEGNGNIPILGRVALAGLTLREVENKISQQLTREYLQEAPEVNAVLSAPRPADIAVLGEVSRPGFYGLATGAPIITALISAGGSTGNADLRTVMLRRTLVDGTVLEKRIDLYTPLVTGQKPPLIRLQGGDTIVVAKLEIGNSQNYDRSLIARSTLPKPNITVRVLSPANTGVGFRNLSLPNGSTFLDVIASLPPNDPLLVDDEVALMRFAPEKGGIASQKLNTKAAINGDIAQNIPLQDEDTIVVSRTLLGKIFNAFDVITQPIRSVFGFRAFFDGLFGNDD